MILRIFAGIAAVLLILTVFFAADLFIGNPVSKNRAKNKAAAYIHNQYGGLNLEIKEVVYNSKDGSYAVSAYSETSVDTHFSLSYKDGEIVKDDYAVTVLSGMNTMDRFCGEYEKSLTPLIQEKTGAVTDISVMPEKLDSYDVELDADLDKKLTENVHIDIRCSGGTNAKFFAEVLVTAYGVMKENGYAAAEFSIIGQLETALAELKGITPAHIEGKNLEAALQKAITDGEYDGITAFSKGQK